MKVDFKIYSSMFLATYLNHVQKFNDFFLNFDQILAIENLKKHLILTFLFFNVAFMAMLGKR
jgi:hypothetical protein